MRMHFERAGPNLRGMRLLSKCFEFDDCDLKKLTGPRKLLYPVLRFSNSLQLRAHHAGVLYYVVCRAAVKKKILPETAQ